MNILRVGWPLLACATIAGCGGGSGSVDAGVPAPGPTPGPPVAQREAAATSTAQNHAQCRELGPYYWEIGDRDGVLAGGSVGGTVYRADTAISIASASKWVYSSYYVQRIGGGANLTPLDIQFFNFRSGYTYFGELSGCSGQPTVAACLAQTDDEGHAFGDLNPATVGFFDYGGGHMQVHAASIAGLGALDNRALANEIRSQIGAEIDFVYGQPQLAGGITMSAAEYAKLLRKIVGGQLLMRSVLGTHPVCVDPATCAQALSTPSPRGEQWHYSIGHWVEDDPLVGDGAFSSAGAFGFYPWIDASKTWYGLISTLNAFGAVDSVQCGRLIRQAWVTGISP